MDQRLADAIRDLQSPDPAQREAALDALGSLNPPDALHLIAPFLKDPAPSVRETASVNLGEIEDERAVPLLLEALSENADDKVRYHLLRALASYHTPQILDRLVEEAFYGKPLRALRQAVAQQLSDYDDEGALQALIGLLRSDDPHVLTATIDSLLKLDQPKLYNVWMDVFIRVPHPYMSRIAAEALAASQQQELLEFVLEASRSDAVAMRRASAYAMALVPPHPSILDRLVQMAKEDADDYVRELSVMSLGDYQHPDVAEALIELVHIPRYQVSSLALESIAEQLRRYPKEVGQATLEQLLQDSSERVSLSARESLRALNALPP